MKIEICTTADGKMLASLARAACRRTSVSAMAPSDTPVLSRFAPLGFTAARFMATGRERHVPHSVPACARSAAVNYDKKINPGRLYKGKVKFYNKKEGYGFITPNHGDKRDIFVSYVRNFSSATPPRSRAPMAKCRRVGRATLTTPCRSIRLPQEEILRPGKRWKDKSRYLELNENVTFKLKQKPVSGKIYAYMVVGALSC